MKRYFYGLLPICILILGITGCKDEITVLHQGEAQNLITEISTPSAAIGDKVIFTVKVDDEQGKGLVLNENIDVALTFSGTGKDGKAVDVKSVFPDFTGHISMKQGDKQGFTEFTVNPELSNYPIDATITAFVRGYKVNFAERAITISDKHYTVMSLKNNSDNVVDEGGKFVLVATVGSLAKEDVVINVSSPDKDLSPDLNTPGKIVGLPEKLVVKAGFQTVESEPISVNAVEGKNNFESVEVSFSTDSREHALYGNTKFTIKVNDLDGDLDESKKLQDERWVYSNPNMVFVSEANQKAVEKWNNTLTVQLMKEGDAHPNPTLAKKGWVFLNAMEFSPIDALTAGGKVNGNGNREPRYTSAQNVDGTQEFQAVDNARYTDMTQEGYLKMWTAYEPNGLEATYWAGSLGMRDYGVSAIYANKFDGNPAGGDSWESSNVRILPGTRVEIRARIRGNIASCNPAIWFQGNKDRVDPWPKYGEVDVLENPANKQGHVNAWQTYHWSNGSDDSFKPTSGSISNIKLDEFNIYWMEWRSNDEVALGINGQENVTIHSDGTVTGEQFDKRGDWTGQHWSFSDSYNPEGMHLLLTFACGNSWAMGEYQKDTEWKNDDEGWKQHVYEKWLDNNLKKIPYAGSKDNTNTPRMEIDFIRYYKTSDYQYKSSGTPAKNVPMY